MVPSLQRLSAPWQLLGFSVLCPHSPFTDCPAEARRGPGSCSCSHNLLPLGRETGRKVLTHTLTVFPHLYRLRLQTYDFISSASSSIVLHLNFTRREGSSPICFATCCILDSALRTLFKQLPLRSQAFLVASRFFLNYLKSSSDRLSELYSVFYNNYRSVCSVMSDSLRLCGL